VSTAAIPPSRCADWTARSITARCPDGRRQTYQSPDAKAGARAPPFLNPQISGSRGSQGKAWHRLMHGQQPFFNLGQRHRLDLIERETLRDGNLPVAVRRNAAYGHHNQSWHPSRARSCARRCLYCNARQNRSRARQTESARNLKHGQSAVHVQHPLLCAPFCRAARRRILMAEKHGRRLVLVTDKKSSIAAPHLVLGKRRHRSRFQDLALGVLGVGHLSELDRACVFFVETHQVLRRTGALPTSTTSHPVAIGSSVPAWPIRFIFNCRGDVR